MGRVETLILLKHDLGIHTNAHDEYLRFLLKSAKERISREGIKEEDTTEYTPKKSRNRYSNAKVLAVGSE